MFKIIKKFFSRNAEYHFDKWQGKESFINSSQGERYTKAFQAIAYYSYIAGHDLITRSEILQSRYEQERIARQKEIGRIPLSAFEEKPTIKG